MVRQLWAGLDVGVESTRVCIINEAGAVVHEADCATTLKTVDKELRLLPRRRTARVSLEAGTGISLARGLRSLGYSVDIYETRKLSKFLRARRNKTDAGDANGIAEAARVGLSVVSKVYLKSLECQSLQSRLTIRRHLIRQRVALVHLLCRQLELYGGRAHPGSRARHLRQCIEPELRTLFGRRPTALSRDLMHILSLCEELVDHQRHLDAELQSLATENDVCRRFMQIPGVGPMCALSFYAAVGTPERFTRSTDIGSYLGMTPRLYQSGLTTRYGGISKMGSSQVRSLLVQASIMFMRMSDPALRLQRWATALAQRRGQARARVALARKLAVVMLAMWKSGESFNPQVSLEAN